MLVYPHGSRSTPRPLLRLAVLAAASTLVTALFGAASPAVAATTLPITVTNSTGSGKTVHLYVLGTEISSGKLGYVDVKGRFHAWPAASGTPTKAPDVSLRGPKAGKSVTVRVPKGISGRLYYSVGSKLSLKLVRSDLGVTSLVQPAPWLADDPNHAKLFDWTEFTYANGLWINSTQVDQFALPAGVTVKGSSGTRTTGRLVASGRQQMIKAMKAKSATANLVVTGSGGQVVRVLAPGHATRVNRLSPSYLKTAINAAWARFATKKLTVRPFPDQPQLSYTGRTVGSRLVFTSASGTRVASFAKPQSVDVFECAGALTAPNDQVVGPIARTLCAALNRGTLSSGKAEPVGSRSAFYKAGPYNAYAKAVHAAMSDGKAYAFAFDDVAQQESLLHDAKPRSVTITLPSLG